MTGSAPSAVLAMSLFSFALMAVIAMATAGLIAVFVAGLTARDRSAAPVAPAAAKPAPATAAAPIEPATVAAISAAIQTMAGGHRIVWIGEARPGAGWTGELRQQHHESHHPRHNR